MGHIFISYSKKDQKYARKLADDLLRRGFDVWIDDRIDYGANWWNAIEKAIEECDAIITIMSPNSQNSRWVQREYLLADNLTKSTFPILLEGEAFPIYVGTQWVDLRSGQLPPDDYYQLLRQVIKPKVGTGNFVAPTPKHLPSIQYRKWASIIAAIILYVFTIIAILIASDSLNNKNTRQPTNTADLGASSSITPIQSSSWTTTPDLTATEKALSFDLTATSDSRAATQVADPSIELTPELQLVEVADDRGTHLGDGEARLYSPSELHVGEASEVRLEIQVTFPPDYFATLQPLPSATPILGTPAPTPSPLPLSALQFVEIREYMGAELGGLDADNFEIEPVPPNGLRRMYSDAINWWKWNIRPTNDQAIGLNNLELRIFIPLDNDPTNLLYTNIIEFQIEVLPTITISSTETPSTRVVPLPTSTTLQAITTEPNVSVSITLLFPSDTSGQRDHLTFAIDDSIQSLDISSMSIRWVSDDDGEQYFNLDEDARLRSLAQSLNSDDCIQLYVTSPNSGLARCQNIIAFPVRGEEVFWEPQAIIFWIYQGDMLVATCATAPQNCTFDWTIIPPETPTQTPTATITATPTCDSTQDLIEIGETSIEYRGSEHVSIEQCELIVGTADRFTDVIDERLPPCTAFMIRGEAEVDLDIWWGDWKHYANATDDDAQTLLDGQISRLREEHNTCPSRGIRTYVCTGTSCEIETVCDGTSC